MDHAKIFLKEAVVAVSLKFEWPEMSPFKDKLYILAVKQEHALARHDGAESDQSGPGGRLVGLVQFVGTKAAVPTALHHSRASVATQTAFFPDDRWTKTVFF